MLLAATTIFFRVHTRVLLTLSVAAFAVILCLAHSVSHPPTPTARSEVAQVRAEAPADLPLKDTRAELPRTAVRLFFLLPHLVRQ